MSCEQFAVCPNEIYKSQCEELREEAAKYRDALKRISAKASIISLDHSEVHLAHEIAGIAQAHLLGVGPQDQKNGVSGL